jgi:hypothetical protein
MPTKKLPDLPKEKQPQKEKREALVQKITSWVLADIEAARLHYEENVLPAALKRLQRFYADKDYYSTLFPQLSKRCGFTMSDVSDTIYWMMPSLMRVFFGSQDPISIEGRTAEDDPEAMKALCNWQLQRKNKGFLKFYRWFLDALQIGHGVMKIRWDRQTEETEDQTIMTPEQFIAWNPEAEGVELVKVEEQPDGNYLVTVKFEKTIKNQPDICNVPVSEFRWVPGNAHEVCRLPFACHKRIMTRSEIEEQVEAGVFESLSDSDYSAARYTPTTGDELDAFYRNERDSESNEGAAGLDESRSQYEVYECYAQYDINDDKISEHVIVTVIGEKIVRLEENELKRPHFAVISPYPDQYQITGMTVDDFIGDIQDAKTALMRQIILNIANNNDRQMAVNTDGLVDPKDLTENRKFIRFKITDGTRRIQDMLQWAPEEPMSSMAMGFMEYMDQLKENRTGITRYNQGLDSKSLNKTASGMQMIMGAANQRIEMVARMFAETGVIDLFEMMVEMNLRYIDNEQVVRLAGKEMRVMPDDLDGHYDLDVAAGVGAGQRQEATQNMMLLLSQIYPAVNNLLGAQGIMITPDKVASALTTLVEQMGYKDASKYAITTEEIQAMAQQMAMMQAGQVPGGMPGEPPMGGQ